MAGRAHRDTTRFALAVRGVVALVVLATATAVVTVGPNLFTGTPVVSARVPADAGPIRPKSSVQYRGVVVGKLIATEPGGGGARLRMAMDSAELGHIPTGVRARVLPKTLFGDQTIELSLPPGAMPSGARLSAGAVVPADTSQRTVELYRVYTRLYDLVNTLRPAQLQVALSTLAEAMRGHGAGIGRAIDTADSLSQRLTPDKTDASLNELSQLGHQVEQSTPDVLATMDDVVSLSRTVNAKQQSIKQLLSSGTELAHQSQGLLADNGERAVQVVHLLDPATKALANDPGAIKSSVDNLESFLKKGSETFRDGRFQIRAPVTFQDPYPYGPQDCPRYPGLNGPNCGPAPAPATGGGTSGAVGSPEEKSALRQMAPQLPSQPDVSGPMGVLLGPIVRGTQVLVP